MSGTWQKVNKWQQDIEITSISRTDYEREELYHSLIGILKKHNSALLTLNLGPRLALREVKQAWIRFQFQLFKQSGLSDSKVSLIPFLFIRNEQGYTWPSLHVIAYSTKDRVTGRSITRIPRKGLGALQDYWKQLVQWDTWPLRLKQTGRPFDSRLNYDTEGIINYLCGPSNMMAPDQRWARLPVHNPELLERKALEKQLSPAA